MRGIKWIAGPLAGDVTPLGTVGSTMMLGRAPECDVQLLTAGISRKHARISVEASGVFVSDLESSNGTLVGTTKITKHRIAVGDVVRLGEAAFELVIWDKVAAVSELDELKLMSGPAEQDTNVIPLAGEETARVQIRGSGPTIPPAPRCGHPLHAQAIREKWRLCPQCGAKTS